MSTRFADSVVYGHLWSSPEMDAVFGEEARLRAWLEILSALAGAQADLGIVPPAVADALAVGNLAEQLDLDVMADETRRTGHSMLGLIRALEPLLAPEVHRYVYYGATVQDVTDTWTALVMRRVGGIVWHELRQLEAVLLELATRHRATVMAGRTHGQVGSPITLGLKVASWTDEIGRHLARLAQGADRWLVGQLGGGVGTLAFFGPSGLALRARFCERLRLADPGMPWLSARDRVAEFAHLLAMVTATLARMGNEVYELARPEIAELAEAASPEAVSSITMPHKRNPERAEHLVTLSRLVRLAASGLLEGMVVEHERDGRAWKAEWATFPEACLLTGAALCMARQLAEGLEVDPAAMARTLDAQAGYATSEVVLAALAPRLGKHQAQAVLQEALRLGAASGADAAGALAAAGDRLDEVLPPSLRHGPWDQADTGSATTMVDAAVARAERRRAQERPTWP